MKLYRRLAQPHQRLEMADDLKKQIGLSPISEAQESGSADYHLH
jgi:hypothetical protein